MKTLLASTSSAVLGQELLIARIDGRLERRVVLDPTRAYSIGRSNRCDIPLKPRSISRRHALLVSLADRWLVLDTGSRRGLMSPEGPTRRADLSTVGWVSLGPLTLVLLDQTASGDPSVALDSADETLPDPSIDAPVGRLLPRHLVEPVLLLEQLGATGDAPRVIDLNETDHATIGSDAAVEIRLPAEAGIAPLHAVLYREPRSWVVIDAGGGVLSDGRRWIRRRLEPGVEAVVGGYRLRAVQAERPGLLRRDEPADPADEAPPRSAAGEPSSGLRVEE